VIRHLLSLAYASLGHEQISKAVMAVPAKFTARQRTATAEAFKQVGGRVAGEGREWVGEWMWVDGWVGGWYC
jgi:molecular chaperone DnaK (HSP70)